MTISWGMILLGAALIYGGWTNRSVFSLLRGDNTVVKPTVPAGTSGIRSAA